MNIRQDVKDNPKPFYRYVCSRMKSKDKVGPLKDSVGNVIDDDKGMCDKLNEFFGSVLQQKMLQICRRSTGCLMQMTVKN